MLIHIILACSYMFNSGASAISAAPDFIASLTAPETPRVAVAEPTPASAERDAVAAPNSERHAVAAPITEAPVAPSAPAIAVVAPAFPIEGAITGALNLPTILPQTKGRSSADEVVQKVQDFYKDTKRLTAKFRQVTFQKVMGRKQTSDGKVYIKKPGKMRWDYKKVKKGKTRTDKSFISDGKQLWAVFHDDKQFMKKKLEDNLLPVAVTFLYGKGDLTSDFKATLVKGSKYGTKSDYVLKLIPKKPSAQYKILWLVVSPDNFRVTQSIVENSEGDTNHFRFFEPNTTKSIRDSWFVFAEKAALKKDYREASPPQEPEKK